MNDAFTCRSSETRSRPQADVFPESRDNYVELVSVSHNVVLYQKCSNNFYLEQCISQRHFRRHCKLSKNGPCTLWSMSSAQDQDQGSWNKDVSHCFKSTCKKMFMASQHWMNVQRIFWCMVIASRYTSSSGVLWCRCVRELLLIFYESASIGIFHSFWCMSLRCTICTRGHWSTGGSFGLDVWLGAVSFPSAAFSL